MRHEEVRQNDVRVLLPARQADERCPVERLGEQVLHRCLYVWLHAVWAAKQDENMADRRAASGDTGPTVISMMRQLRAKREELLPVSIHD